MPETQTAFFPSTSELSSAQAGGVRLSERFSLALSDTAPRGLNGDQLGKESGSSIDFQDHRAYAAGDDPRNINWQAFARTGSYSVKLFRSEVRPLVDCVVDVTGSQFAFPGKRLQFLTLLYFVSASCQKAGVDFRIYLSSGASHRKLDVSSLAPERLRALLSDSLAGASTEAESGASSFPPALRTIPFRRESYRVLLSDLLFSSDPARFLAPFTRHAGRSVILCCSATEESAPDWSGNLDLEDAESHLKRPYHITPAVLQSYEEAYVRHFSLWDHAARRSRVSLVRFSDRHEISDSLRKEGLGTGAFQMVNAR